MTAGTIIASRRLRQSMTADQEHALYEALGRTRRNSTAVRVDKAALEALLIDHGRVLAALRDGYETSDGRLGP